MRVFLKFFAKWRKSLNPVVLRKFFAMLHNLIHSDVGDLVKKRFLALLGYLFLINGLNVINSYVNRDFMSSIEHRDLAEFTRYALLYLVVFAALTIAAVLFRYTEECLALVWRKWLTQRALSRYMRERVYFRLYSLTEMNNPDQRITEDVRTLTTQTLAFLLMFLNASFTVIAFSGVLWSISPLLFGVAVGYALFGSLMTISLGKPLVQLNFDQLDYEANFRARLVHIRENAESIALLRREGRLKLRLFDRLEALTINFQRIIEINRNVGFFTTGYNFLIQIIPALIVAPLFIAGKTEFGEITQSALAFGHLLGAFSLIITQFQSISSYTAVAMRLSALHEAMKNERPPTMPAIEVCKGCGSVAYADVTLWQTDNKRVLIRSLSLSIPTGTYLLVRAANEVAEKALFKATADLWYCGEGRILHPGHDDIFFLPERAYVPPGTLRELLLRTGQEDKISNERIFTSLKILNLNSVLKKAGNLDTERPWSDILSMSEQQRLSFARVLLAAPRFVFLDHPSRSLSECNVDELLKLLRRNGITYLTLGDMTDDLRFYDRLLEIDEDGTWRLRLPNPPAGRRQIDQIIDHKTQSTNGCAC